MALVHLLKRFRFQRSADTEVKSACLSSLAVHHSLKI